MMRVGDNPADHDRAAGEVGERASRHVDCGRAKADAGVIGIRVVADPERDLSELGKSIVVEHHPRRRA